MIYSTIYTIDTPESIDKFLPPASQRWEETEDDEECEEAGHHRKLVAILTQEEFDEFIDEVMIYAEDVETMGSLGAPGFGMGWAPAISFTNYDEGVILNAYVTPIPGHLKDGEIVPDGELPHDWERVRRETIEKYS